MTNSNNNSNPPIPNTNTNPSPTTVSGNTTTGNTWTISSTVAIPLNNIQWFGWPAPPVEQAKTSTKKKDDRDGCDCKQCKEFYPYAEPNQEDGTLICYKCRSGW